jgi:hypothetical protein
LDWQESKEKIKEIEKISFKEKKSYLTSKSESDTLLHDLKIEDDIDEFLPSNSTKEKHINIKLVITEIQTSQFGRNLVQAVSPILSFFHLNEKFGIFHTGLIIGPWYQIFFI